MNDNTNHTSHIRISCAETVLLRISEERITPTSKSVILLTETSKWLIVASSIAVASGAWAVIAFRLANIDHIIEVSGDDLSTLLSYIPVVWIGTVVASGLIGSRAFRHTMYGYRPSSAILMILTASTSIIIGTLLAFIGIGYTVDRMTEDVVPLHNSMEKVNYILYPHSEIPYLRGRPLWIEQ